MALEQEICVKKRHYIRMCGELTLLIPYSY